MMSYAQIYEESRPVLPQKMKEIVCTYLDRKPELLIDLGCGTGLSTTGWFDCSARVIGIDVQKDLLQILAAKHTEVEIHHMSAEEMNFAPSSADVITCSQSFQWVCSPKVLELIKKILKKDGLLMISEYEIMPEGCPELEKLFFNFIQKVNGFIRKENINAQPYKKKASGSYMEILAESGNFSFLRKLCFTGREAFDAERFVKLALSQGKVYVALNNGRNDELRQEFSVFEETVKRVFCGRVLYLDFSYNVIVGINNGKTITTV